MASHLPGAELAGTSCSSRPAAPRCVRRFEASFLSLTTAPRALGACTMLLLHISCRLRTAMTHELMMVSRRDACALQAVVRSRRSDLPCYFLAADNAASSVRQCQVRCSFARDGSCDGAVDVSIIAHVNAWQPARLPRASAAYQLASCRRCANTAPPGRVLDAENVARCVQRDRAMHMIPAWPMHNHAVNLRSRSVLMQQPAPTYSVQLRDAGEWGIYAHRHLFKWRPKNRHVAATTEIKQCSVAGAANCALSHSRSFSTK